MVTATDLQRGKPGGFAPAKLVEAAFKTPKGAPASAEGDQETTALRVPRDRRGRSHARSDRRASSSRALLQNSYADDIVGAYVTRLENDFGVTLNQQALNQVIGGGHAHNPGN